MKCESCNSKLDINCKICEEPTWCSKCGVDYVGRFFTKKDIEQREQAVFNGKKLKHTYMTYGCDCCIKCEEKSEVIDEDRLEKEGWI